MFASGASTLLQAKTLLLDLGTAGTTMTNSTIDNVISDNIGGDCTNAACVPSKAIRSIARMAAAERRELSTASSSSKNWLSRAREHETLTVNKVRERESPLDIVQRNKLLDVAIISNGYFVKSHEMNLEIQHFYSTRNNMMKPNETKHDGLSRSRIRVRSKKFLIATGASPIIPKKFQQEAQNADLPIYTYQTFLRPTDFLESSNIWRFLDETMNKTSTTIASDIGKKKIVVVGGGATACELSQSIARLGWKTNNAIIQVHLVAPELLKGEDVTLQHAAFQLLSAECNIQFYLGQRLEQILSDKSVELSNGSQILDVDAILLCLGRQPSLESLCLENANIAWNATHGLLVNPKTLQSISAPHVFACGDCASTVASKPLTRTAAHGAWTGYHAASNALLPKLLTWGAKTVHSTVPRVVYTDPELVSVGMSLRDCIDRYGLDGFVRLLVGEKGTDRSDIEAEERPFTNHIGFVEIRVTKVDGRVLGFTGCGPAASELANEMSVIVENRLSVRHVAKALHSYPSYGYLLHRVALALAFSNTWGLLEACGPVGGIVAHPGRLITKTVQFVTRKSYHISKRKRQYYRNMKRWHSEGSCKGLIMKLPPDKQSKDSNSSKSNIKIISFLEIYENKEDFITEWTNQFGELNNNNSTNCGRVLSDMNIVTYKEWVKLKPSLKSYII